MFAIPRFVIPSSKLGNGIYIETIKHSSGTSKAGIQGANHANGLPAGYRKSDTQKQTHIVAPFKHYAPNAFVQI